MPDAKADHAAKRRRNEIGHDYCSACLPIPSDPQIARNTIQPRIVCCHTIITRLLSGPRRSARSLSLDSSAGLHHDSLRREDGGPTVPVCALASFAVSLGTFAHSVPASPIR